MIAGDEPMVAADKPMVVVDKFVVDADAHGPCAEAATNEPEGFPGGSSDPSVLTEYVEHVLENTFY